MQTETVTLPAPLGHQGPGELERKLANPSPAAPQQKPAPKPVPKPGKPAKQPEQDIFAQLAMTESGKDNIRLVRTLSYRADELILKQGLDKFSAGVVNIVQGVLGRLLIQVSFAIDVAQNRDFDIKSDPLNWVVRQQLLPTLEQLNALFMKNEKDRATMQHARKLGGQGKVPMANPADSSEASRADAAQ